MMQIPLRELYFSYSRSGGPGGQNTNKVNSKVTLNWSLHETNALSEIVKKRFENEFPNKINELGVVVIQSSKFRDQGRNTADCVEKLSLMIEKVLRPPKKRIPTKTPLASKNKRIEAKKLKSKTKQNRKVTLEF